MKSQERQDQSQNRLFIKECSICGKEPLYTMFKKGKRYSYCQECVSKKESKWDE